MLFDLLSISTRRKQRKDIQYLAIQPTKMIFLLGAVWQWF